MLASVKGADHVRVGSLEFFLKLFLVFECVLEYVSACDSVESAEGRLLKEHRRLDVESDMVLSCSSACNIFPCLIRNFFDKGS